MLRECYGFWGKDSTIPAYNPDFHKEKGNRVRKRLVCRRFYLVKGGIIVSLCKALIWSVL